MALALTGHDDTSGESVDGLASLSAGVSEIYGSRRRLPPLPSFLIESIGQLFGFHIGDGAYHCVVILS